MYNWKKTLKKFVVVSVEIVLAGSVVYLTDNMMWLGLVPILEGLRNWVKHYLIKK